MIKEKEVGGKKYFRCPLCDFFYRERGLAQQCKNFCKTNKSCSLEITKHAIKIK